MSTVCNVSGFNRVSNKCSNPVGTNVICFVADRMMRDVDRDSQQVASVRATPHPPDGGALPCKACLVRLRLMKVIWLVLLSSPSN